MQKAPPDANLAPGIFSFILTKDSRKGIVIDMATETFTNKEKILFTHDKCTPLGGEAVKYEGVVLIQSWRGNPAGTKFSEIRFSGPDVRVSKCPKGTDILDWQAQLAFRESDVGQECEGKGSQLGIQEVWKAGWKAGWKDGGCISSTRNRSNADIILGKEKEIEEFLAHVLEKGSLSESPAEVSPGQDPNYYELDATVVEALVMILRAQLAEARQEWPAKK